MSEPQPPAPDWEAVLETDQIYEAELAALRLREAGLEAQVVDQSYRQEPVRLVRSLARVRLFMPADRAAEARAVLATAATPLPEDLEDGPS